MMFFLSKSDLSVPFGCKVLNLFSEADFVDLVEGNLERIVAYFEQISSQMLTLVDGGRENDVLIHPLRIQISDIENGIEKINQEFIQRKEGFKNLTFMLTTSKMRPFGNLFTK